MSIFSSFFGLWKKLILFVLILAVAIPLRYGSIDHQYLTVRLLHSVLSLKCSFIPDSDRPTLSADFRAFEDVLRMKPLVKQNLSGDPMIGMKSLRSSNNMGPLFPKPLQCQIQKQIFEHDGHSVHTYWIDYPARKFQVKSDKLLLYFHGGGYIAGDIHGYSGIECHLSQLFNVTVLHVEYRLSPEHPLLAAVDDGITVFHALLRYGVSPSQLIFMGDSAGGGLVLLITQALLARRLPTSRAVVPLSPWTDISTSGESYTSNKKTDVIVDTDTLRWSTPLLLGSEDLKLAFDNPLLSPLFGSFKGFPPMYVVVGTAEVLVDDARAAVKKARKAGVDVTFEEGLHLMHIYPLFFPYFPEARNTLDNINNWIQTVFKE